MATSRVSMGLKELGCCFVFVIIPLAFFGTIASSSGSVGSVYQEDDGWQVKSVGGMAMDEQNSNVYLTSSAILKDNAASSETRCLIRMLSFSPEEGFASVTDRSAFPKGGEDLVCPGDPRCILRRQLLEDFQQVDETVYPEKCSKIYIQNNHIFVLGRLPQDESSSLAGEARGSVMVMTLDANKIGGNETQEFRPQEEPLAAAFDGDNTIYLVSHPQSHSNAVVLYRYSKTGDGSLWQQDLRHNHFLVSAPSQRIHVASLHVILGGHYLVLASTISQGSDYSSGHFGIYHAHNQSIVEDLGSAIADPDPNAGMHTIECVCLDEQRSDASIAILYRVSIFLIDGKTISVVKKIRLQKEGNVLRQSTIWTQELIGHSVKKCAVTNDALVLAEFTYNDYTGLTKMDVGTQPLLTVSKRSTTNGEVMWLAQEETPTYSDANSIIRLTDVTMDSQGHVLVYGQVDNHWDVSDDIVLLQALHGTSGNMLASSNSPPMVVKHSRSSGGRSSSPRSGSFDIMSREELLSNYQIPIIIVVVGLVVSIILCIWMTCTQRENAQEKEKETFQKRIMNIFSYLRPFQANQVDIQQSPTGGFNATYTEDLIKNEESETETSLSNRL